MKKIFALALSALTVSALAVSAAALPADRTDVTVYKNTPTIDGTINLGEWDKQNAIQMTEDNCSAWAGEVSNIVTFYYSWDDAGLYIAAQVSDTDVVLATDAPGIYGADAFQIALDPHGLLADGGETGGMFYTLGLLEDGSLAALYHPYGGAGEEFEFTGSGRTTADGWEFEAIIPWSSIEILADDGYAWTHADGEYMNALIAMLDRNDGGAETNAYKTIIDGRDSFLPEDYAMKLNLSTFVAPSLEATEDPAPAEDTTPVEDGGAEVDTTPAPVAPSTADAGVAVAAVAMAAAAAVVLAKKKN